MKIDGNKITYYLAYNCMSVEDLAKKTHLASATITRVIRGTAKPRPKTIGLIANALNVEIKLLLEDGQEY